MPRAGLSTQKVVAEAAAVADELGWDHLSLAVVAQRLVVRLPSLYRHIASLEGLRAQVSALGTRQLAEELAQAAVGRARTEALSAIAIAYRAFARRRPGLYAATVTAPRQDDPDQRAAAAAVMHVVRAVLDGYDLDEDDAVDAARALRACVHGFVSLETGGGFGLPADVDRSYRRLIAGSDAALVAWATTEAR